MANFAYNLAKSKLLKGAIDLDSGGDDVRAILVMTNTTADTEDDKEFISGFTTLDEMDGAGYARVALTGESVGDDAANDRAEFDGTDITFSGVSAGTRSVQAMVIYKHVTNDADSIPIAFIDTGGFPFAPGGGDITVTWNAEGILQLA